MQLLENVYIYFVVYILLAQGHATIFVMPVDGDDINTGKSVLGINNQPFCLNDDVHERLLCYVHIHNLEIPQDPESDLELFVPLLGYLEQDGFQI